MSEIRNVSSVAITIPGHGVTVEPGETVTVPAEVADELVRRAEWGKSTAKRQTAAEVLAEVAGDPAKARVALDAEHTQGDKARKTLISELSAIIETAPADESEEDQ
jgi:hypothetical protein